MKCSIKTQLDSRGSHGGHLKLFDLPRLLEMLQNIK